MDYQFGIVFFVLGMVCQAYAQISTNLVCYDCDPRKTGPQCANPVESDVLQTNCDKKFRTRDSNSTIICLSANITYSGSSQDTGIYRGCYIQDASVVNFCDWFKQETDNRNAVLVSCVSCNTTRCNDVILDPNGPPSKGSPLFNVAFAITAVSILFSSLL